MEINKKWEHFGNVEKETKLYKILNRINVKWQEIGKGDFSPYHTKFACVLYDNKGNNYNFDYQCNTQYSRPNEEDLLYCVINDSFAYYDCIVGDDDDNIEEFGNMFGYDNIKDLLKAYRGCKNAYNSIRKMLNDEEIETLREYFEELGF